MKRRIVLLALLMLATSCAPGYYRSRQFNNLSAPAGPCYKSQR